MEPGQEWLTCRELRVELLGQTTVRDCERLSAKDITELRRRVEARDEREEPRHPKVDS